MFITFLVPIILSVVGVLLGIGTIFAWPKMFSSCNAVSFDATQNYQYYFQAYLKEGEAAADALCGYTTTSGPSPTQ